MLDLDYSLDSWSNLWFSNYYFIIGTSFESGNLSSEVTREILTRNTEKRLKLALKWEKNSKIFPRSQTSFSPQKSLAVKIWTNLSFYPKYS